MLSLFELKVDMLVVFLTKDMSFLTEDEIVIMNVLVSTPDVYANAVRTIEEGFTNEL